MKKARTEIHYINNKRGEKRRRGEVINVSDIRIEIRDRLEMARNYWHEPLNKSFSSGINQARTKISIAFLSNSINCSRKENNVLQYFLEHNEELN